MHQYSPFFSSNSACIIQTRTQDAQILTKTTAGGEKKEKEERADDRPINRTAGCTRVEKVKGEVRTTPYWCRPIPLYFHNFFFSFHESFIFYFFLPPLPHLLPFLPSFCLSSATPPTTSKPASGPSTLAQESSPQKKTFSESPDPNNLGGRGGGEGEGGRGVEAAKGRGLPPRSV